VSGSLRHDPVAIWAHLMPLLELIKELHPSVDSPFSERWPTAQYCNKKNFCLLAQFGIKFGWQNSTWNFTEAGHGKGLTDGIGGLIKRSADDVVAHGRSVTSVTDIIQLVQNRNVNVEMANSSKLYPFLYYLYSCCSCSKPS